MARSRRNKGRKPKSDGPAPGPELIDWDEVAPAPGEESSALAAILRENIEEKEDSPRPRLLNAEDQGPDSPGNLFSFSENFSRIFRPGPKSEVQRLQ